MSRISAADFSQLRVGVWVRRCRELRQVVSLMPASRRLRFRIQSQSTFVELRFPLPLSFSFPPSSLFAFPSFVFRFLPLARTPFPLRAVARLLLLLSGVGVFAVSWFLSPIPGFVRFLSPLPGVSSLFFLPRDPKLSRSSHLSGRRFPLRPVPHRARRAATRPLHPVPSPRRTDRGPGRAPPSTAIA